jgi:hypothetical protein
VRSKLTSLLPEHSIHRPFVKDLLVPTVSIIIRLVMDRTQRQNNSPQRTTSISNKLLLGPPKTLVPSRTVKLDLITIGNHQISAPNQTIAACSTVAMRQTTIYQPCNPMPAPGTKLT